MHFQDIAHPFGDITNAPSTSSSSPESEFFDVDLESDLSDVPSRSPSRLGFNCAISRLEPEPTNMKLNNIPETLKWTHSLFQRITADEGDNEEGCTAILSCPSSSESLCEDSESDFSDSSGEEESTSPILLFPTPPDQSSRPPAHPPGLLSPLSPSRSSTPTTPTPPRLDYPHHGLSRSSLMHQKWFWAARYEEWAEWNAHILVAEDADEAYGGMAILAGTCPALRGPLWRVSALDRDVPAKHHSTAPMPTNLNAPIYPRIGDVSALRDPYGAIIDRCFCQFPLWTIHKALFVFDMHHRAASRDGGDANVSLTVDNCDHESLSTDDTLVEDENDNGGFVRPRKCDEGEEDECKNEDESVRAWEVSWYARWELLVELVKRDEILLKGFPSPAPPPPPVVKSPPPLFYFAGEDGEDDVDEEEEDYGELVSNPLFTRGRSSFEPGSDLVQTHFAGVGVGSGARMICV